MSDKPDLLAALCDQDEEIAGMRDELVKLRTDNAALLAACKEAMADYQCHFRADGPHEDCKCWFCNMGNAVSAVEQSNQPSGGREGS